VWRPASHGVAGFWAATALYTSVYVAFMSVFPTVSSADLPFGPFLPQANVTTAHNYDPGTKLCPLQWSSCVTLRG
jgi:hypothetical protein